MTKTTDPVAYLMKREADLFGLATPEEVGIFLQVEDAALLLVTQATRQSDDACKQDDCDACRALANLWWSVYWALPIQTRLDVGDLVRSGGGAIPFHPVHHPR